MACGPARSPPLRAAAPQPRCAPAPRGAPLVVQVANQSPSCPTNRIVLPYTIFRQSLADPAAGEAAVRFRHVDCAPPGSIVADVDTYRLSGGGYLRLDLQQVAGSGALAGVELRGAPAAAVRRAAGGAGAKGMSKPRHACMHACNAGLAFACWWGGRTLSARALLHALLGLWSPPPYTRRAAPLALAARRGGGGPRRRRRLEAPEQHLRRQVGGLGAARAPAGRCVSPATAVKWWWPARLSPRPPPPSTPPLCRRARSGMMGVWDWALSFSPAPAAAPQRLRPDDSRVHSRLDAPTLRCSLSRRRRLAPRRAALESR